MIVCLLIFATAVLPAVAQETLTLQQAIDQALGTNPSLTAAEQRIGAARGQRTQAGLSPNPRLNLQLENVRPYTRPAFVFWEATDSFAFLQQTVETASKRDRRSDVANVQIRIAELERDLLRRQIAQRVRQAYWSAAGAQRALELLRETVKSFTQTVEYHENRVKEGAMAEGDLLRVRLEAERFALNETNAALDLERARINLFREMGQTEFPRPRLIEPIEEKEDRLRLADPNQAAAQRIEARLAREILNRARANQNLQQAVSRPNFDILFGYKRTGALDTMMAGFQMDLPWLNRNQGNIESAAAETRTAQANLAATEAMVRAEVAAAQAEYEARRRQLTGTLLRMREQAAETLRIAQAAYREGGTDLLRLLDAERLRLETEIIYLRAMVEYRQSIANLETAMGVLQ